MLRIVSQIREMNPWPGPNSVLVPDNCPIHKDEQLTEVVEAHGIRMVYTPAYMPRFQPCELIFGIFKRHLKKYEIPFDTLVADMGLLRAMQDCITPYLM